MVVNIGTKLIFQNMKQSPIALLTKCSDYYNLKDKPLALDYPKKIDNLRLNHTGFSWEVKLPYQLSTNATLSGAHLNLTNRYCLDQFHCHWGVDNSKGSEHTVDDKFYAAELHLVHYNRNKYQTMSKAARHSDGLVVVGVFLDADEKYENHPELEKIIEQLKEIKSRGDFTLLKKPLHLNDLLPINKSYWSYQGSLTTPPYFESVTWFILKQPIRCSTRQTENFRSLRSLVKENDSQNFIHDMNKVINLTSENQIIRNHREPQPINGRTIVKFDELY